MELKCFFYYLGNKSLSSKLLVETSLLKPTKDYKTFHNIVKLMTAHYDIMTLCHYNLWHYKSLSPTIACLAEQKSSFKILKIAKVAKSAFLNQSDF